MICRQLGLGFPKKALSTARYGMPWRFVMHNFNCSGDELSITHCHYIGPRKGRCRYYDVAAVQCTPYAPDLVMDVGELKHSMYAESRSLQLLRCAYEEKTVLPRKLLLSGTGQNVLIAPFSGSQPASGIGAQLLFPIQ